MLREGPSHTALLSYRASVKSGLVSGEIHKVLGAQKSGIEILFTRILWLGDGLDIGDLGTFQM